MDLKFLVRVSCAFVILVREEGRKERTKKIKEPLAPSAVHFVLKSKHRTVAVGT